ncbi:MAG: tetratricopeptide repeat protein [Elusimicrobia bacterium]|nr:tetratricopeptide repeat protein [Elusimicrobiota bacterium]
MLPALLCVPVLAVFYRALGCDFVNWDDNQYVLSNPALLGSWLNALGFSPGYYHPVTTLTYKLDLVLAGLNPAMFHFTSLLLHLANCVSAFCLLTALGARRNAAFLGALLFGIHPVHVEPAVWISGRKELLWGLFSSWTLIAYLKYAGTGLKRHFFYSLAFFVLAVLSKPFALVLPLLLPLADYYRGRPFTFRLLLEKAPYLAIALPLLTLSTSPSGFLLKTDRLAFSFSSLVVSGQNALFYAKKLLLPVNLSALYPPLELSRNPASHSALLLLAVLAAFLLARSARRASQGTALPAAGPPAGPGAARKIIFGLGFFLATIFPALVISPPADRYCYLPALGLFFLYAEAVSWLHGFLRERAAGRPSLPGRLLLLAVAAHFLVLSLAAASRVPVWKSSLTLWEDVLEKNPLEHMGYYGRGGVRAAAGDHDGALRDLTRCVELAPHNWKAFSNRGRLFSEMREFDKAIADYSAAMAVKPGEAVLFLNRGNAYLLKGDKARAVADYDRALALAPGYAPALENKRRAAGLRR